MLALKFTEESSDHNHRESVKQQMHPPLSAGPRSRCPSAGHPGPFHWRPLTEGPTGLPASRRDCRQGDRPPSCHPQSPCPLNKNRSTLETLPVCYHRHQFLMPANGRRWVRMNDLHCPRSFVKSIAPPNVSPIDSMSSCILSIHCSLGLPLFLFPSNLACSALSGIWSAVILCNVQTIGIFAGQLCQIELFGYLMLY